MAQEIVDCSELTLAPQWVKLYDNGIIWAADAKFQPAECSDFFIYYPKYNSYVVLQKRSWSDDIGIALTFVSNSPPDHVCIASDLRFVPAKFCSRVPNPDD